MEADSFLFFLVFTLHYFHWKCSLLAPHTTVCNLGHVLATLYVKHWFKYFPNLLICLQAKISMQSINYILIYLIKKSCNLWFQSLFSFSLTTIIFLDMGFVMKDRIISNFIVHVFSKNQWQNFFKIVKKKPFWGHFWPFSPKYNIF